MYNGNPDAEDDIPLIQQVVGEVLQASIVPAIELLLNVCKGLGDRQDALEKAVMEDLIGGLTSEAEKIHRGRIGSELRSKYADLGEYGDAFKQLFDKDIYDDALERIFPAMKEAKFAPDKLDELMQGLKGQYAERFKGVKLERPSEPAALEVEIETKPAEEDVDASDLEGVSPGVRDAIVARRRAKKGE